MQCVCRLLLWLTTAEEDRDLLAPIGRLAHLVRSWQIDVGSIRAAAVENLPYHVESLRHAERDLVLYRRQMRREFKRCIRANVPRWKIRLACRS